MFSAITGTHLGLCGGATHDCFEICDAAAEIAQNGLKMTDVAQSNISTKTFHKHFFHMLHSNTDQPQSSMQFYWLIAW